jgi:SAM-dependent methyltransferase
MGIAINKEVHSPFTGSRCTEVWGKRDNQIIYRCVDTGAIFFDRDNGSVDTYDTFYSYLPSFDSRRIQWEISIRRRKYKHQLAKMGEYSPGRRLVDIGAGPGYFCKVACEEGWSAKGVEVNETAVQHGRQHFGVDYIFLDELPEASVDAITCHHVLEHLAKPREFLDTILSKLVPGGLLVIHVPHQQPLSFWIRNLWIGGFCHQKDTLCSLYGNIHVSGFTRTSLRSALESTGFKTYFTRSVGMWTMYYDPFFIKTYIREMAWLALTKKAARHLVEFVGIPFGIGDWLVGYFVKP